MAGQIIGGCEEEEKQEEEESGFSSFVNFLRLAFLQYFHTLSA